MLTRAQQILIKRAQQEAGLTDPEYREAVATVSGMPNCTSSKDSRLTDEHLDNLLSYFEAIHWQRVDAGALQPSCKADAVFRKRGFWASRNRKGNNSRDRHTAVELGRQINALQDELTKFGCGLAYFQAIENRIRQQGQPGAPFNLVNYKAALARTLAAKRKKLETAGN